MEDLRLIRSFVTTVTCQGTFSTAARLLEITPAAVSKNVQKLEEQLGVRLFSRTTRALRITEEGQLIYEHYAAALRDIEMARQVVPKRKDSVAGLVRVTLTSSFGRHVVMPLISSFLRLHPQVRIDVRLDDRLTSMVQDGFDVGIRGGKVPESGRFVARRIAPLQRVVCGSPAYLARCVEPRHPSELAAHECVLWRNPQLGKVFPWEFEIDGRTVSVPVAGRLVCEDLDTVAEAGVRGDGLVMLGAYRAIPLIQNGSLQPVLGRFVSRSRYYYIHYPNRQFLAPRTRLLVNFLREHIAAMNLNQID